MKNIAIIVCSGKGQRMGANLPKQFLKLKEKPIITHTIEKFEKCEMIDEIIIVVSKEYKEYFENEIILKNNFKKISKITLGGKERLNSVYNGLINIKDENSIVLIHDGVRPFIKIDHIKNIINETKKYKACVLGVRAKDTIKICQNNTIKQTPERENIWLAQTPQAFEFSIIKKAYEKAIENNFFGTDDASLVENIGIDVKMVLGDYENIKITTKEDLKIGEIFLN